MTMDAVLSVVAGIVCAQLTLIYLRRRRATQEPGSTTVSDPTDPGLLQTAERELLNARIDTTPCRVSILHSGPNKIQDIKMLRTTLKLGLRDAKELVDNLPQTLREPMPTGQAITLAERLRSSGMTVHLS